MADLAKMLDDDDIQEVKSSKSASTKSTRGAIPALLLKARTDAHLTHLRQKDKTLALHNAMSIFYDSVGDLVDTYIETSMGIDDSFTLEEVDESEVIANPLTYFKGLYKTILVERESIKEPFLLNQIDEMTQLIAHTLYRLKNIVT
jgi:hypothetical protein